MTDMVRAHVPCHHTSPIGRPSPNRANNFYFIDIRGPGGGVARVRSYNRALPGTTLEVHFNPATFFQGHNVFGSPDLRCLVADAMEYIAQWLGLHPTTSNRRKWAAGDFTLTEVHAAAHVGLGTPENVRAATDLLAVSARSRRDLSRSTDTTAYWGERHTRYWMLRAYDKAAEVEVRRGVAGLDPRVRACAHGALRFELVLRRKTLRREGLDRGRAWEATTAGRLVRTFLNNLSFTDQWNLPGDVLEAMEDKDRMVYYHWRNSTRPPFDNRGTLRKYRTRLLNYGIDIAIPFSACGEELKARLGGRNSREIVNLEFTRPPGWAFGCSGLLYPPASSSAPGS